MDGTAWRGYGTRVVTYSLIGLCLAAAVLTRFSTDTEVMIRYGAKVNDLIAAGEYWRLLTAIFLHFGPLHLAFNMLFLYNMGPGLEILFGKWRFAAIFLGAGLSGSIASYIGTPGISVGASGALFGFIGAYLYWWVRKPSAARGIGKQMLTLLVFNLLFGVFSNSLDNWAHLGGFTGGFLSAAAVGLPEERTKAVTRLAAASALAAALLLGFSYGSYMETKQERMTAAMQRHLSQAQALLQQKDYGGAAVELEAAIKYNPDKAQANLAQIHYVLGYCYAKTGKYEPAVEHLSEASRLKPGDAQISQALAYLKKNKTLPD